MERKVSIETAYKIMGNNMIGPNELNEFASNLLDTNFNHELIPEIQFSELELKKKSISHLLILFYPISNLEKSKISIATQTHTECLQTSSG